MKKWEVIEGQTFPQIKNTEEEKIDNFALGTQKSLGPDNGKKMEVIIEKQTFPSKRFKSVLKVIYSNSPLNATPTSANPTSAPFQLVLINSHLREFPH